MKSLVIGLGSGRTGSQSLSALMDAQPHCIGTHESFHMPWDVDLEQLDKAMDNLLSRDAPLIADIACYWLNYVPLIRLMHPNTKFICIYRDEEEILGSFMRKTWGRNHWTRQGSRHKVEKHDKRHYLWFPHYDLPKKDACRKYIRTYYSLAACMVGDDFKIFDISSLNTVEGIKSILTFAGVPEELQVIQVFHENIFPGDP